MVFADGFDVNMKFLYENRRCSDGGKMSFSAHDLNAWKVYKEKRSRGLAFIGLAVTVVRAGQPALWHGRSPWAHGTKQQLHLMQPRCGKRLLYQRIRSWVMPTVYQRNAEKCSSMQMDTWAVKTVSQRSVLFCMNDEASPQRKFVAVFDGMLYGGEARSPCGRRIIGLKSVLCLEY